MVAGPGQGRAALTFSGQEHVTLASAGQARAMVAGPGQGRAALTVSGQEHVTLAGAGQARAGERVTRQGRPGRAGDQGGLCVSCRHAARSGMAPYRLWPGASAVSGLAKRVCTLAALS